MAKQKYPIVGVGVIVTNEKGDVLVIKRKGSDAPKYSISGGHLELGETFEQGAIREIKEELNIKIIDPKVIAVTNNLETFREESVHYASIILLAREFVGRLKINEPQFCEQFMWCNPHYLPQPHFDASRLAIECYVKNSFYEGIR